MTDAEDRAEELVYRADVAIGMAIKSCADVMGACHALVMDGGRPELWKPVEDYCDAMGALLDAARGLQRAQEAALRAMRGGADDYAEKEG